MNSIADAGMEAHIISRNRSGLQRFERLRDNVYIHRLPDFGSRLLREVFSFPAFFSPVWLTEVVSVVRKTNANLLIVRDLPLTPTALFTASILGIPVMMDMAENYPAMLKDTWNYRGRKPTDMFLRSPFALRVLERAVLPRLDGILVVCEESKLRVASLSKRRNGIWVVGNSPSLKYTTMDSEDPSTLHLRGHEGLKLLYIGGLEESRGLDLVIRAIADLIKQIPDILMVIVGKGSSEHKLKRLCAQLKIQNHILFTGWIDQRYVASLIRHSDICLVPHLVTDHTETTLPNKLFDYMAQGKPVVVSNAKPLKRIVSSHNCGRCYDPLDMGEFSRCILGLVDLSTRNELGRAGLKAFHEKFNWQEDEKVLLEAVCSVAVSKGVVIR